MAVSLVGSSGNITGTTNGTSATLTFSTGAAAAGDIVIATWVNTATSSATTTLALTSSAGTSYNLLTTSASGIGNLRLAIWYRVLTSAETTVGSCATPSGQDSTTLSAFVLRGFDPAVIFNSTIAIGTSSLPDSPPITPTGSGDAIFSIVGILSNTTLTAPSTLLNPVSTGRTDTRSNSQGAGWIQSTGPTAYNIGPWAAGAATSWAAFSVTLRSTEAAVLTWLDMASQSTHNPPACLWGGRPDVVGY